MEKDFRCAHCMYTTARKHNLKRHVIKMHNKCKRLLECCGLIFQTKCCMRDHFTMCHKDGYTCSICRRKFQRKALLTRHLTVLGGKKELRCSFCKYETSHKSNLQRHQKVHKKRVTVCDPSPDKTLHKRSSFGLPIRQDNTTREIHHRHNGDDENHIHGYMNHYGRSENTAKKDSQIMKNISIHCAPPHPLWGYTIHDRQYDRFSDYEPCAEMTLTPATSIDYCRNKANFLRCRQSFCETGHLLDFKKSLKCRQEVSNVYHPIVSEKENFLRCKPEVREVDHLFGIEKNSYLGFKQIITESDHFIDIEKNSLQEGRPEIRETDNFVDINQKSLLGLRQEDRAAVYFFDFETKKIDGSNTEVKENDNLVDIEKKILSRCSPEAIKSDVLDIEKDTSIAGHKNAELAKKDDGEESESSTSSNAKPSRLCLYPYKCNFCYSRFGTQQELCYHNTVCTV